AGPRTCTRNACNSSRPWNRSSRSRRRSHAYEGARPSRWATARTRRDRPDDRSRRRLSYAHRCRATPPRGQAGLRGCRKSMRIRRAAAWPGSARIALPRADAVLRGRALINQRLDALEAAAHGVEQRTMDRVVRRRETVVRELLRANDVDEPRMAERREMSRYGRLRQLEQIDDVAYAELTGRQHIQNP